MDDAPPTTSKNGPSRSSDLAMATSIFFLAGLVRAIPYQYVSTPYGVAFRDGDSYSHMWRIWNAASKSIPLSARDPYVNFPHGGEVLWSPAFDWLLASVVRLCGLDQTSAEMFCAWIPLVLGATAVALAAVITARTFSRAAGWIAGLILAVLPGNFLYTQLGYLDHHAAVALIATAMLGGAMRIVDQNSRAPNSWPILAGALSAFALAIWAGALLHIVILQIALLTWSLGASDLHTAQARTWRLALAHAVAALAILPLSLRDWEIFGNFSPLALTRFQPTWYAAGAICLAATSLAWRIPGIGGSRAQRIGCAVVVGTVGLAIAFAGIPQLAAVLDDSAGWFTGDVEFIANIVETAPLFRTGNDSRPAWWQPVFLFSPLLFLFPLAMLALGWRYRRPDCWLLLFWAAAFGALTLSQVRFANTFSVVHSIVWGGAIVVLLDWTRDRVQVPRTNVAIRAMILGLVALGVVVSASFYYAPRLRNHGYAVVKPQIQARRAIARWLRDTRPQTLDEDGNPDSGLLCAWTAGHEIRYLSGHAVHQDGFGPYVSPENTKLASRYYASTNEDEAIDILNELGTRYVVADHLGSGQPPYPIRSMTRRMVDLYGTGSEIASGQFGGTSWIPALTRHRLIMAAPNGAGGAWVYEIVPGALVIGRSTPGSRVTAEIELGSPSAGEQRTWTTRRQANARGEYVLRLPYSTLDARLSPERTRTPYRIRNHNGMVLLDVPEAAVREGKTVLAPTIE
jgi:asparagine N-glycosylation enzyme membrane subunit Stt3